MGLKSCSLSVPWLRPCWTGRRGYGWNSLLVLAIPCGACILTGYVPVVRSHVFTFFFFGTTLLCLAEIRAGRVPGPPSFCRRFYWFGRRLRRI